MKFAVAAIIAAVASAARVQTAQKEAKVEEEPKWIANQRLVQDLINGWSQPEVLEADAEAESEAAATWPGDWDSLREQQKESEIKGRLDGKKLFRIGNTQNNWSDEAGWGWKAEDASDAWRDGWKEIKETAATEEWGPQDWFNAGQGWEPAPEVADEPVVVEQEEVAEVQSAQLLGADAGEVAAEEEDMEAEKSDKEDDAEKALWKERRDLWRQARDDYKTTQPTWESYLPEPVEVVAAAEDAEAEAEERKGKWWETANFGEDVDVESLRANWEADRDQWRQDRPSWESWSAEQGW